MMRTAQRRAIRSTLLLKRFLIPLLAAALFVAFAVAGAKAAPADQPTDAAKAGVRNNAASLLADLLGNEKNLSKILIIKHPSPEVGKLVKAISQAAGDGEKQLQALAKTDTTLNLRDLQLPPGEKAARAGSAKAKEHELLSTSGAAFEFNLLLTQVQGLSYGSQLARVAADNSPAPDQARAFHTLDAQLDELFKQAVAHMRSPSRK